MLPEEMRSITELEIGFVPSSASRWCIGIVGQSNTVLGHRVELGELEAAIRKATGLDGVVALAWPTSASGADRPEAFLEAERFDTKTLLAELQSILPAYVPSNTGIFQYFPLNANGKYDRRALEIIA
jgi:hypothetical protein